MFAVCLTGMCGGALFDRYVTVLGKKKEHEQRSAGFWDLARSPQAAVKKISSCCSESLRGLAFVSSLLRLSRAGFSICPWLVGDGHK